jgi:hypothetical protein
MINEIANEMAGFRDDVECFSLNTSKLWIIRCRNHARSFKYDSTVEATTYYIGMLKMRWV